MNFQELSTIELYFKRYDKLLYSSEINKETKEYLCLHKFVKFLKDAYKFLEITKLPEANEKGIPTPDFLFQTETDRFFVEVTAAIQCQEKSFENKFDKFIQCINTKLAKEGLEKFFGGHVVPSEYITPLTLQRVYLMLTIYLKTI